jgi:uncharacterized protein (TIGR02246 family)
MLTPAHWMRVVCSGSPDAVLALYTPNAVLVPTYSRRVLQGHRELRAYFQRFLGGKPGLCGRIDSVINQGPVVSGIYTFQWTPQVGVRPQQAQARFTFVYTPTPEGWRISTHHSSGMPTELT